MKFSAQEEYGLRCMITIAREGDGVSLTIPEISQREGMTTSHVAKILAILRKAGFVDSTRGQLGGYTLAKKPNQIVIRDLLNALGGPIFDEDFCERYTGVLPQCAHETDCLIRPLWGNIQHVINEVVGKYTLEDLLEDRIESPTIHLTHPIDTTSRNQTHETDDSNVSTKA